LRHCCVQSDNSGNRRYDKFERSANIAVGVVFRRQYKRILSCSAIDKKRPPDERQKEVKNEVGEQGLRTWNVLTLRRRFYSKIVVELLIICWTCQQAHVHEAGNFVLVDQIGAIAIRLVWLPWMRSR
jgi:hypothetical protein